ncbi:MAG: hypothetical protein AAGB31_09220 [Bdellovibrio sp.]
MKKIALISFLSGLNLVSSAQAQLATHSTAVAGLRDARKEMEVQTENQVLEKLEASRLEDERNRRHQFESLNFSVVDDGSPSSPTLEGSSL